MVDSIKKQDAIMLRQRTTSTTLQQATRTTCALPVPACTPALDADDMRGGRP